MQHLLLTDGLAPRAPWWPEVPVTDGLLPGGLGWAFGAVLEHANFGGLDVTEWILKGEANQEWCYFDHAYFDPVYF